MALVCNKEIDYKICCNDFKDICSMCLPLTALIPRCKAFVISVLVYFHRGITGTLMVSYVR